MALEDEHNNEKSQLQKSFEQQRSEQERKFQALQKELNAFRRKMEDETHRQATKINQLSSEILNKDQQNLALQASLDKRKDVEAQLGEALRREEKNKAARDSLQAELEDSTDYILELEEKVYKANKTSLELLKQLKDAESEIVALQRYIADLKSRIAVYIPVKEDSIDKRLAEFINNYPDRAKLKIMFMRESEGVYQFGTKRVAVKVEKDNIKIRVGGGYLSIDEFLDQYTPVELEKLERKDPLKRFSEKVAV